MGRDLIKVGLSGGRGDSPYSSSPKVSPRQEQGGPPVCRVDSGRHPIVSSAAKSLRVHKD